MVFLTPGGGTMGELIRSMDWSTTPLGPIEQWPQTLLTNLVTILESPFPQFICWGRELTMLYNDDYIELLGEKHSALGKCLLEVWPEARETIEPLIEKAFAGESVLMESTPFTLLRHGYPEQNWFDFSFSPLRDEHGNVAGLLNITFETTKPVRELHEREERYRTLFESIDEGFCILEMIFNEEQKPIDWRYIETNSLFEKQTGINDVLGRTIKELVPNIEHFWLDTYGKVALTGESTRFEDHSKSMGRWWDIYAFRIDHPDERKVACLFRDITERKRTEESLRESEARYRDLVQNANSAIIRWKADGTLTFFNEYAQSFFGYSADEVLGKHVGMLVPQKESTGADLSGLVRDILANPEHYVNFVNENVRKDGSRVWMVWTNKPIFDEHGDVAEILAIGADITERKRAEEALRRSEQRFRAVFEGAGDAIYVHDLQGRFFDANRKGYERIGYTKDELMGMSPMEINPPGQRENVPKRIEKILKEGSLFFETVHVRKDGSRFPVEVNSNLIEYDDKPTIISIVRDISEQQQIKEELIRSERVYRSIAQHLPDGAVYVFDKDLRFLVAEGQALSMIGHSKEQLEGRTIYDLDDVTRRIIEPRYKQVLAGEALFFETEYRGRVISSHYVPIKDTRGETILGMVVANDITLQVEARRQLERSKDELEQRVRERTTELEQANRAKDEFLANMSHEIRTPMSGVLGLTEILLHHELPKNVHRDLAMIRSSAESVMTLINDLFDLSRIQQGKFDFHPEEFELRSMVRDAIGPFEFQARAMDLEFSVSFDESVPSLILCDKDRLGQVIKNLVSNAIKFTEQGYVRVHVNAEKRDEDTLRLNFAVADSGVGIPKSKQAEVFSAFTQLDPSYSKKFAGMGLGLAISKSLVEGMGGEISVVSTRGKGATFHFYVTCGIVTGEQALTAPSIALNDLPPMTILLAEDNPVNRLFLRRALITAGHAVFEVENGVQALEVLAKDRFDLILMDIQMPEMDGVEATRLIRSGRHGKADIPIIALTAYAMKGDREKFLENGMDGYVTKPVDFGELARTIAEVCEVREKSES
jgi:two-component system, sensor histidine kinase